MARAGSSTSTRKTAAQKRAEAEAADQAALGTTETDSDSTPVEAEDSNVTTEATEEANPVSTETVEPEVVETPNSDTTEASEATTEATPEVDAEKAAAEAKAEGEYTEYQAVVDTALADRDEATGNLPVVQIEAVKAKYRTLSGAKYKNKAKNLLTEKLREAVAGRDIILGTAIMALTDAVHNAGPAPRQSAPKATVDPAAAYREKMVILHLAYALGRGHSPEGVDTEAELAKVENTVNELTDAADAYYAWATNTADDKGDEPEVDALVKKAVKASLLKAASRAASTGGTSTPREAGAPRRNIRTHIAQAFDKLGKGAGEILKVAEIAKQETDEYPAGDASPGAVSAALKSEKGVPGFELATDGSGHVAAKKL